VKGVVERFAKLLAAGKQSIKRVSSAENGCLNTYLIHKCYFWEVKLL